MIQLLTLAALLTPMLLILPVPAVPPIARHLPAPAEKRRSPMKAPPNP
jgi:hypothetical protein